MNQPTLFDPEGARQARKDAIDRVEEHAHAEFMRAASEAVRYVAGRMSEFTTDDTVRWVRVVYPDVSTHDDRAWGAVMRDAVRNRLIVNTHRVRESVMVSNHRRPKTIWRSLIVKEDVL